MTAWMERRRSMCFLTVLCSALTGIPPFYLVTVSCGVLRLPLGEYLVAGTFGRAVRVAALTMLPQLFALPR